MVLTRKVPKRQWFGVTLARQLNVCSTCCVVVDVCQSTIIIIGECWSWSLLRIPKKFSEASEKLEAEASAGAKQNLTNCCRKILEVSKAFLLSDEVLIIVDLVRKGKEALLVFRQGREEGQKWSR